MISELVSGLFNTIGFTWNTRQGVIVPTEDDVDQVLDDVAATLYDEPVGTRLETSGLLVTKTATGHSVYVYVGDYN